MLETLSEDRTVDAVSNDDDDSRGSSLAIAFGPGPSKEEIVGSIMDNTGEEDASVEEEFERQLNEKGYADTEFLRLPERRSSDPYDDDDDDEYGPSYLDFLVPRSNARTAQRDPGSESGDDDLEAATEFGVFGRVRVSTRSWTIPQAVAKVRAVAADFRASFSDKSSSDGDGNENPRFWLLLLGLLYRLSSLAGTILVRHTIEKVSVRHSDYPRGHTHATWSFCFCPQKEQEKRSWVLLDSSNGFQRL
jgi:hypothetical protein